MPGLVGRRTELEFLEGCLDQAVAGRGGVIFITGEAGAGKSTLVQGFLESVREKHPEVRRLDAFCSEQYGAGEPYQPFVEALRDLAVAASREGRDRSFWTLAREVAPYWLEAVPVLGQVAAATVATAKEISDAFDGRGGAQQAAPNEEALFFQYAELLFTAAADSPLLLFIDDLHWADRATVSLLGHIGRQAVEHPLLIVGTYRSADVAVEKHPVQEAQLELERYKAATVVTLEPLQDTALEELVESELSGPVQQDLVEWLRRAAGSNALFFTEMLRWAVDQGIAQLEHGEWKLTRVPDELEVPRTAEAVLEKRLGRLNPDAVHDLEYASVAGAEFDSVTLSRLLEVDELELEDRLEGLERVHGLIRLVETRELPGGEPASLYEFQHSLIQNVLHKKLRGKRRILLHRRMADLLEEIYPQPEAVAHKLAVHYDEGRRSEEAYEFSMMASSHAERMHAHWTSIAMLERALRNAGDNEQAFQALSTLGRTHHRIGRFGDALGTLEQALAVAEDTDEPKRILRTRCSMLDVERDLGSRPPDELVPEMERLERMAREIGDDVELCEVLWRFMRLPGTTREGDLAHGREALELAEAVGEPRLVAQAHYALATLLAFSPDREDALPHLDQAVEIYAELKDVYQEAWCRNARGTARILNGDYHAAAEDLREALEGYREIGDPTRLAAVSTNYGVLLTRLGAWQEAEATLREAIETLERLGSQSRVLSALYNYAEHLFARGQLADADGQYRELLERAHQNGAWEFQALAHAGIGLAAIEGGRIEAARQACGECQQIMSAESGSWKEAQELCLLLQARLAALDGEEEEALRLLRAAKEAARRDLHRWAWMRLVEGEVVQRFDPEAAMTAVEEAHRVLRELGAAPLRERAAELLQRIGGAA